jgi:hypothetical protein
LLQRQFNSAAAFASFSWSQDTVEKMSPSASKMGQLGCADDAEEADFHGFFSWLIRVDLLHPRQPRSYFLRCQKCPDIRSFTLIF